MQGTVEVLYMYYLTLLLLQPWNVYNYESYLMDGKVRLVKIKLFSHNYKAISVRTKIQTQSHVDLMLLLIKKKKNIYIYIYIHTTIYLSTPRICWAFVLINICGC